MNIQKRASRPRSVATSIRLDRADIELAKTLAEKSGTRYQTYLKRVIHQQLLKEAGEAFPSGGGR